MPEIFYICDRKACEPCTNDDCEHTSDIVHSVTFKRSLPIDIRNFEKIGDGYFERRKE